MYFRYWYDNSALKGILEFIDIEDAEKFFDAYDESAHFNSQYAVSKLDDLFLEKFEPFPEEWENVRQMVLTSVRKGYSFSYNFRGNEDDFCIIAKECLKDTIETILDVLEDFPYFGAYDYGSVVIVATHGTPSGKCVIEPED